MPEPAFDRRVALSRVGGDEELLKEIAEIFLEDYPKVLAEIQAALASGDARRLEQSAHSLKGSAGNFGAKAVVGAASRLEQLGRAGRANGVASEMPASGEMNDLGQALLALRAELEAL
jgi:two-component system, sensor histidine kinase and response regulator